MSQPKTLRFVPLALGMLAAACSGRDNAATDSVAAAPAAVTHVDSVLPRDEEMRRFTAGLDTVTALEGGATSRDALVRRFVTALEKRDTAAFAPMRITKREFAYLYYPSNPMGKPPYDLGPGLMHFQLEGNSGKGLVHVLEERGGRASGYVDHACQKVEAQGENRVHQLCTVRRVQAPGDTVTESLFGAILEREGRFKFVSYTNKL